MASGGPRTPRKPAPASGPGRLARRTDGGPAQKLRDIPDAHYGENADFRELQSAAPLSATPDVRAAAAAPQGKVTLPTPLSAPSQRPEEPVTAGAAAGPGPGIESLGLPPAGVQMRGNLLETLAQLHPYDVTGAIADLIAQANYRSR